MDKIGAIPTPNLTDREILLLAYQQLQSVSEEFKLYKTANDSVLQDLRSRMVQIEQHMSTADALKESAELQTKKQIKTVGVVFTAINLIVSIVIKTLP